MPGPNANWTAGLSVHYSQDSSLIYWFNGTQAVQVPLGGAAGLGSGPPDCPLLCPFLHEITP